MFRFFFSLPVLSVLLVSFLATPARADFAEGRKAYAEKNWPQAILHLRPAAERGDANAMIILGNMYLNGLGVGQNPVEAFTLYRKAALRHHPDAIVMVAALYQKGIGAPKNLRYAAEWYGRAAKLGHSTGAFFYAIHMFRGNKVLGAPAANQDAAFPPDHEAAYKWFKIAEKNTSNPKLAQAARQLAANVASRLPSDRLDILNKEIIDWSAEMPDTLGPFPEEVTRETATTSAGKPAPAPEKKN